MSIIAEPVRKSLVIRFLSNSIKSDAEVREAATIIDASLGNHDKKILVIDLTRVNFMTSSMIGELVKLKKKCDKEKMKLRLAGLSPDVEEIFKITKMNKLFKVYDNADKAIG